ncbi:MAG: HAD family hydrolase [Candidatus Gastranaerophilales bacterium]|nr:HAD family hydrolase [Candidatus Gastranaerophilales bacterium]
MKKLLTGLIIFTIFLGIFSGSVLANEPKSIDTLTGNFKNPIKVVFSDIDGTLLPKSYYLTDSLKSAKDAAKKLRDAKIPLIFVTGRSYYEAKKFAKSLHNETTYYVTLQGTEIFNNKDQLIYKNYINHADAIKILKNLECFLKTNYPDAKIYFYIDGKPHSTVAFKLPYCLEKLTVIKSFKDLGNFTPNKIGVYEKTPEKLKSINTYISKTFPDYYSYLSTECLCEMTNKNVTKGSAVKKVSEILEIDLKNAAAFGDAENDISMIETVKNAGGLGIAVDNAMDTLKQNANYITTSVYDGGVNHAVDKILENNLKVIK